MNMNTLTNDEDSIIAVKASQQAKKEIRNKSMEIHEYHYNLMSCFKKAYESYNNTKEELYATHLQCNKDYTYTRDYEEKAYKKACDLALRKYYDECDLAINDSKHLREIIKDV